MKRQFSSKWKSSKKPSKQKKYIANAPRHLMKVFMRAHLSKELRQKYGTRAVTIRKGDKVRVVRGQFRKKEGKVESINVKNSKVYITGIEFVKKDGGKALYPIDPSNLVVQEIYAGDKKRLKTKGGKTS